jgi:hypothetical protein
MDTTLNIEIVNDTSNVPELSEELIEMINDDSLKKIRDDKRKLRCKNTNKNRYDNDTEYKEHKKQQSKQNYILLKNAKKHFLLYNNILTL